MPGVLWVRSELFDHGVFNTSVRWTVLKVLDFLTPLQWVGSMNISRTQWVEVTTTRCKPALTEVEALAFWYITSVLQQSMLGKKTEWLDVRIIGLVLMCQVFTPHRVRTDHKAMTAESWPSREITSVSSPRHSPRGSSPRVAVSAQSSAGRGRDASAALLAFVRQHCGYFLQIACFSLASEPSNVKAEEFDMLGLLLGAGSSFSTPFPQISEAVPDLSVKKALPFKDIRKWAEKSLVWNEEVYPAMEVPSRDVESKTVNVSGMHKATWFQRPPNVDSEFLNITSCNDCVIYVTSAARFCFVAGCHECTIIMTAVSDLCTISNCEKITVHVAAHCFKMENCTDSSAYLYCHVPPILTGDTRGIKLAPFNVLYSQMDRVLASANLKLEPEYIDVWARPVCSTLGSPDETLGGRSDKSDDNSTYHFVHPKTFQPVIVPEAGPTRPKFNTLCLPEVYDAAFKKGVEEMRSFHRMLSEIEDESKRKRAQQVIQGHFREWLQSTGKSRQLADLAKMAQTGQSTSGSPPSG
mmetsp:Transcript_113013/g.200298  ORF Transcript_113013/g.200298 Transcript_113013/m.200298 type:complete len:524 (-) Transcript_113013:91-1662(-)